MNLNVTLITSEKNWMEQNAINQLNALVTLPGAVRAVGLPDLHAGKTPIGAVLETRGIFYPHLIGNDIGCGMGLFRTGVAFAKYKQDRWVTRLNNIRALEDLPCENPYPEQSPIYDLGTIGSGNHFAEFQRVESVYDADTLQSLGIDAREVLLLVHAGSRGYGQRILSKFPGFTGLAPDSDEAREYLALHDDALIWAARNRMLAAQKLVEHLGYTPTLKTAVDCCHNLLEQRGDLFIHRKGAVCAGKGAVVIPGSRGSLTYLVVPAPDTAFSAHSLSHGAGRKWARSLCKGRIREKYDRDTIRQTQLKSRVVCHDTDLLFEEAPEAYKNIQPVIQSLLEHELISVVATLRPLITFKG